MRGICRGDGDGSYVTNLAGDKVTLPEGATDAALTPYHVARSKLFVRERSAKTLVRLDTVAIEANSFTAGFEIGCKISLNPAGWPASS